ncbi:AraC family transcriptional regulator [Bacillus horti]|uniref:Iron complex transport system substrate-binding protein n=1 Tax=Caldalkalibacillus horti TaxID=77523 RepID=A0ABT9VVU2_9BACI|nr:AraC family transcriptional regulator [Bacillus horti]MDQ0165103.1 iron complex transport system substrate-binding protein [Bacillus horti]
MVINYNEGRSYIEQLKKAGVRNLDIQDHILLWNNAALKVLDIRHHKLEPEQSLPAYQLPASTFLYVVGGKAQIFLDNRMYNIDRTYVCHAGKGAFLDILEIVEELEYYLVFYKATLSLPYRKQLIRIQKASNPFQIQYGFAPNHPISLFLTIEQMDKYWQQYGMLEKFRTKGLFHQFVYELLKQLEEQGERIQSPNLVTQAVRYLEERYADPITLPLLAEDFGCTPRQIQRLFKAAFKMGPMKYLTIVRINQAKVLLDKGDFSLKQIAEAVGYTDSYYFSRLFKKYTGLSPVHFKEQSLRDLGRQNPSFLSFLPIAVDKRQRYSDDDNHYHYKNKGALPIMYKSSKSAMAISMMLTLTLLLSACSGATGTGSTSSPATNSPSQSTGQGSEAGSSSATGTEGAARIIQHLKGEMTLEEVPQKIVVLDVQYIDHMLALGEQPIGSVIATSDKADFPEYLMDKLPDNVKILGTYQEPNLEAILESGPDLIISTEFQENVYDDLTKIAPTLMFERNEDWRTVIESFGKILDKEQEAKDVVEQYQQKVSELKVKLEEKLEGETVALIRPREEMIRLHGTDHRTAAILYTDLGLNPPDMVQEAESSESIALEVMPDLNADHLFLLMDDSNTELIGEFQNTNVWQGLTAVQDEQLYVVNTTMWIGYYGPLAINLVIDEIAEAFEDQ